MSKLIVRTEEQKELVEKLANGTSVWFPDEAEVEGFHIDDYITFDDMAAIVGYLQGLQDNGDGASAAVNAIQEGCKRMLGNMQVGGEHYQQAIQPVEYIHANGLPFIEGNVVKYISRHKRKGGAQDVEKAMSYCAMLLKMEYGYTDEQISKLYGK